MKLSIVSGFLLSAFMTAASFATTTPIAIAGLVTTKDQKRISADVTLYYDKEATAKLASGRSNAWGIYLITHDSVDTDITSLWVLLDVDAASAQPQLVTLEGNGSIRSGTAQDLVVDTAQRVAKSPDMKAVADYMAAVIETEAIRVYAGGENEEIGQKRILSQTAPIRVTLGVKALSSVLKLVPDFIQGNVKARPQLFEHTNSLLERFSRDVQ
jgi:hypothetical protein